MTRTRTRGVASSSVLAHYSHNCPFGWQGDVGYTIPFPEEPYELIIDERPQWTRFGGCYHQKTTAKLLRASHSWPGDGNCDNNPMLPLRVNSISDRRWFLGALGVTQAQVFESAFSTDWDQLNAEAFLDMKPSLDPGFSLTNFVLELRDIKKLGSFMKLAHFRHIKKLHKTIAGEYLNYQFGWKLFVKDAISIYEKLQDYEKRLRDYKSRQGQTLTSHYKQTLEKDSVVEGEVWDIAHQYGTSWKTTSTTVYHATMKYTYTIPNIDDEYAKIKGVLDAMGIHLGFSVVWEAIPFSFVVDWVFNVQDYLESIETDWLESKVTVVDFCSSVVTYADAQLSGQTDFLLGPSTCDLGSTALEMYQRRRMIPNAQDFGLKQSHRYGTKQIVLSAALLVA